MKQNYTEIVISCYKTVKKLTSDFSVCCLSSDNFGTAYKPCLFSFFEFKYKNCKNILTKCKLCTPIETRLSSYENSTSNQHVQVGYPQVKLNEVRLQLILKSCYVNISVSKVTFVSK